MNRLYFFLLKSRDYVHLLLANYQLWPLAMTFSFYMMPLKHQALFTNSVSLAWNTYLSWKANKQLISTEQTSEQITERRLKENTEQTAEQGQNGELSGKESSKYEKIGANPAVVENKGDAKLFLSDINNNYVYLNNNKDMKNNNNNNDHNPMLMQDSNSNSDIDLSGKQTNLASKSFFARGSNIGFLSHPYALLPR